MTCTHAPHQPHGCENSSSICAAYCAHDVLLTKHKWPSLCAHNECEKRKKVCSDTNAIKKTKQKQDTCQQVSLTSISRLNMFSLVIFLSWEGSKIVLSILASCFYFFAQNRSAIMRPIDHTSDVYRHGNGSRHGNRHRFHHTLSCSEYFFQPQNLVHVAPTLSTRAFFLGHRSRACRWRVSEKQKKRPALDSVARSLHPYTVCWRDLVWNVCKTTLRGVCVYGPLSIN